jgi:hypothetical protein
MRSNTTDNTTADEEQHKPLVPHVLVSVLIGALFVLAVGLVFLLPAVIVLHLFDWLELSGVGLEVTWILALWALSAIVSVAGYYLIEQTFVKEVLKRRIVSKLPKPFTE